MPGVKRQVGVGRPWHRQQHRQTCGGQTGTPCPQLFCEVSLHPPVAVSTSLGCGVEDRGGGLVPAHPGKAQTSPAVCGRQAWRPHSQTFNKHEIITLGTAAVAAAATLLYSGTSPGGRSGLGAHAQSEHFSSPSRGREATPLSQGQGSVRDKRKQVPKRKGQRPPARERHSSLSASTPAPPGTQQRPSLWGEFGNPKAGSGGRYIGPTPN